LPEAAWRRCYVHSLRNRSNGYQELKRRTHAMGISPPPRAVCAWSGHCPSRCTKTGSKPLATSTRTNSRNTRKSLSGVGRLRAAGRLRRRVTRGSVPYAQPHQRRRKLRSLRSLGKVSIYIFLKSSGYLRPETSRSRGGGLRSQLDLT
jgi:hypothetical protein